MIILNIGSRSYHEARQKIERTSLVFSTEVWSGEDVAKDRDGEIIRNIRDLDQYIENHNGGFGDDF